eukprot:8996002-Pyramimonas_sp.AAC.1
MVRRNDQHAHAKVRAGGGWPACRRGVVRAVRFRSQDVGARVGSRFEVPTRMWPDVADGITFSRFACRSFSLPGCHPGHPGYPGCPG